MTLEEMIELIDETLSWRHRDAIIAALRAGQGIRDSLTLTVHDYYQSQVVEYKQHKLIPAINNWDKATK